ncbi:DUF2860 family protein [Psychroserpens luteolus]|uniref:DUF2860 family protein n=1 Tax=Psychroserpens luteolus TaxID=2855840 RepID=UPI001E3272A4|nr:DUF2860 family protein [Psychroserpens luteolus]MCD2258352.1 DUF2860 domain-containing protein [Psychroserpens luteolus]
MKHSFFFLFLFAIGLSSAQVDLSVNTLSGYEYNINRSPETLFEDSELVDKEDLIFSGFYQEIGVRLRYSKELKSGVFKAYLTPKRRFFIAEPELNLLLLRSGLKYTHTFKKKLKWESGINYTIKDREGLDLDENELSVPLGYNLLNVKSGLHLRLYKNNRTQFHLHYGKKNFNASENRTTSYNKYGVSVDFKTIYWKNHLLYSYGIAAKFFHRDYVTLNEEEASEISRTWQYINFELYYTISLNKKWTIKPSIDYQKRIDATNDRFGYNQIRAGLNLNFKSEKFKNSINFSYNNRRFDMLQAENNSGASIDNLKYDYLRVRYNADYKLNDKLSLISEAYLVNRASNNDNQNTTTFRSYQNFYVGIGLRWQLF